MLNDLEMDPLKKFQNGYIIAEIGSVHDGSFGNALKLIELAKSVGVDAVKFQTHLADYETTRSAPSPAYFTQESRYDYFKRTEFSSQQINDLRDFAGECGLDFISSVFSVEAVELLEEISVGIHKVPSGEVTNLPLLHRLKATGKPVLLSSGMSDWDELDEAVRVFGSQYPLVVMQCSSEYPCRPENVGLNLFRQMSDRYGYSVGFSDHTMGLAAPICAVALGVSVIEKHLTFSREMYGSDARHSLEPAEFSLLVNELRAAWTMISNPVNKDDIENYLELKTVFEKTLVARTNLAKNHVMKIEDFCLKKAGGGMKPKCMPDFVGRKLVEAVSSDHVFRPEDFL